MSVKISRREEKRDTSLRDFILAATLPLLLSGLIGYYTGRTGDINQGVNQQTIAAVEARADTTTAQLRAQNNFLRTVDSLTALLLADQEERKKEFFQITSQAIPGQDMGAGVFATWNIAINRDFEVYSNAITAEQGKLRGRPELSEADLLPVITLFKELNQLTKSYFIYQREMYSVQTLDQREMSEALAEKDKELGTDIDKLQAQLDLAEQKLQLKDIKIERLTTQLAGANTPVAEPVSYQQEKATINAAVTEIESISRQLPSGIIVTRSKKEELASKIMQQVAVIENALENIE
ncbi:hypothetical protein [Lewinella sp. IMCC34183]|uniref:hypothetical protein n=1 Tax=Lewinella sp. IMCC34183 TaxID=2248762 RepID=UPI000E237C25|nr:hypothetical protein [Lewinella sp. IMCC34183]